MNDSTLSSRMRALGVRKPADREAQKLTIVPAPFATLDAQVPAVGLDDLPAERQPDPRAVLFRRVERQQGLPQHVVGHAGALVDHLDEVAAVRQPLDADPDRPAVRGCLDRILQQVDQHLLHLGGVEPAGGARQLTGGLELEQFTGPVEPLRPRHELLCRRRQTREPGVALEEAGQVLDSLTDRLVDRPESIEALSLAGHGHSRVGQRGDRCEGVVQLVGDDADHLLPDLRLLPGQLGRSSVAAGTACAGSG